MHLAKRNGLEGYEIVPLMSSGNVTNALVEGTIEFGVVAVSNAVAGPVIETEKALEGKDGIEIVDTIGIPIHHCLFVKDMTAEIDSVASHIQALLQSKGNLEALCPKTGRIEVEDTAYAAEMLANGKFPNSTAVICRKDAGMHYKLNLKAENIEDDSNNITTFSLLKMRP